MSLVPTSWTLVDSYIHFLLFYLPFWFYVYLSLLLVMAFFSSIVFFQFDFSLSCFFFSILFPWIFLLNLYQPRRLKLYTFYCFIYFLFFCLFVLLVIPYGFSLFSTLFFYRLFSPPSCFFLQLGICIFLFLVFFISFLFFLFLFLVFFLRFYS